MLPAAIEGSYDLRVEFTRESGDDMIVAILPVGSSSCEAFFSGMHGRSHGLEKIDGHNADSTPIAIRPGTLTNSKRHTAIFQVRVRGDDASILVLLDNQPCLRWTGKQSSLDVHPAWHLPDAKRPALGASDDTVTFHRAALRIISGKAKWIGR